MPLNQILKYKIKADKYFTDEGVYSYEQLILYRDQLKDNKIDNKTKKLDVLKERKEEHHQQLKKQIKNLDYGLSI